MLEKLLLKRKARIELGLAEDYTSGPWVAPNDTSYVGFFFEKDVNAFSHKLREKYLAVKAEIDLKEAEFKLKYGSDWRQVAVRQAYKLVKEYVDSDEEDYTQLDESLKALTTNLIEAEETPEHKDKGEVLIGDDYMVWDSNQKKFVFSRKSFAATTTEEEKDKRIEKLKAYHKAAMLDTITGKKDRTKGMTSALIKMSGSDKPLITFKESDDSEYGKAGMKRPWGNRNPEMASKAHAEMAKVQREYAKKMKAAGQNSLAARAEAMAKEYDELAKKEPLKEDEEFYKEEISLEEQQSIMSEATLKLIMTEDDAQAHMLNVMRLIEPSKRKDAKAAYKKFREKGLPFAASITMMHDLYKHKKETEGKGMFN